MSLKLKLLAPWRRRLQWSLAFIILGLPFVSIGGECVLRIDIDVLTLYFFGAALRIEELYLVWLLAGALVFLFLLLTMVFGRLWCGWACPQTALVDLSEGVGRRLGLTATPFAMQGDWWRRMLLETFHLALALLVGANLVWYFVPPADYFARLMAGSLGGWSLGTTLAVAGLIFFDLAFVRRLVCRDFCPYGRFQTVLVDSSTLTLRFHPDEAPRCIDCLACNRACPMGIDIRRGYQVECINCGRCLDACRKIMARRGQPGIIRYTFGFSDRSWRGLINPRVGLLLLLFAGVSLALVLNTLHRPVATLKVARDAAIRARKLPDGQLATFFTAYLGNQGRAQARYRLEAEDRHQQKLLLKGATDHIVIPGGNRLQLNFAIVSQPGPANTKTEVRFKLLDSQGKLLAEETAYLYTSEEPVL